MFYHPIRLVFSKPSADDPKPHLVKFLFVAFFARRGQVADTIYILRPLKVEQEPCIRASLHGGNRNDMVNLHVCLFKASVAVSASVRSFRPLKKYLPIISGPLILASIPSIINPIPVQPFNQPFRLLVVLDCIVPAVVPRAPAQKRSLDKIYIFVFINFQNEVSHIFNMKNALKISPPRAGIFSFPLFPGILKTNENRKTKKKGERFNMP